MAAFKAHIVNALPGSPEASALYLVLNGNYCEVYITSTSGAVKMIGNSTMINTLADARITTALADLNLVEYAADITARNALGSGAQRNFLCFVADATGDATVAAGAALYFYRESNTSWTKVAEYESLDVSLAWANITGKPTSSPAQIDTAVTQSHTHANTAFLAKIGESAGAMTYDGSPLGATQWSTLDW